MIQWQPEEREWKLTNVPAAFSSPSQYVAQRAAT